MPEDEQKPSKEKKEPESPFANSDPLTIEESRRLGKKIKDESKSLGHGYDLLDGLEGAWREIERRESGGETVDQEFKENLRKNLERERRRLGKDPF
jgi:hypothetical protein